MRRLRRTAMQCIVTLPAFSAILFAYGQESPSTPVPATPIPAPTGAVTTPEKRVKQKHGHANDFLIRGTVFNDKAFSLPAAEVHIRRAGEKKFRWQSYTNSRGEFAMRVPDGAEYEIAVHAKGFIDQQLPISVQDGGGEQGVVFRMVAKP
jgi:hypothetical protein